MKKLLLLPALVLAMSCLKTPTTMNPLQAAGCDVEAVVTSTFGSVIVNQCAGTDAVACGNALLTALGNVNMCAQPIPATPAPAGLAVVKKWTTVGDITKGDLDAAKQSVKAKAVAQGVVGAVVCPLAYSTVVGLATGLVPPACGCTKNLDAGALGSALVAACIAAVPI